MTALLVRCSVPRTLPEPALDDQAAQRRQADLELAWNGGGETQEILRIAVEQVLQELDAVAEEYRSVPG